MASTSLRSQVDALRHATSGTSSRHIQKKRGRPSLLLSPDEAADVDLSSVREAAVMGLQRLAALDQDFHAFQVTLFSSEAQNTLRDLQTKEANDRIDKSITSFLALLSPHFTSREAHVCLEYLIRHYKIYQHNVEAVVECCLPWHDTVAFARMVQLLSLKGSRWEFLTPVQQTGSPLPREAIARRCAREFGLLRFVCVSARRAAAAAAESSTEQGTPSATASGRAKLFSFYAAVVVEALASLGSSSEPLLRALVPTVVQGLSATKAAEYQMASYMILSALSAKGPLAPAVTSASLTALFCAPCQGGLEPPLLCAVAMAQHQVGFSSKHNTSDSAAPLRLPVAAFKELSSTNSLPAVLAGICRKFDAGAFLWLLLQSYVQHLADSDGDHGSSLTRLCTYPQWPSSALPRLIRRLVDRLLKTFLTVYVDDSHPATIGDANEDCTGRAYAMKAESQKVLRVLGQRYPEEVDAAVSKLGRYVTKNKAFAAAAVTAAKSEGRDDTEDLAKAATRESLKDEALSSLMACTFAGAELAPRMPLKLDDREEKTTSDGNDAIASLAIFHGSTMVALSHPSGAVRARAVRQLASAVSRQAGPVSDRPENDVAKPGAAIADDLVHALRQRLLDEDPQVVLAVAQSETLIQHVILQHASQGAMSWNEDEGVQQHESAASARHVSSLMADCEAAVASWLLMLSQPRPKHPIASVGQVVCELIRLASALSVAHAADATSRDTACKLFFECLPGPHAIARVKMAQEAAMMVPKVATTEQSFAPSANVGRAHKKVCRAIGRAAIKAVALVEDAARDETFGKRISGFSEELHSLQKDGEDQSSRAASERRERTSGGSTSTSGIGPKIKGLKAMSEHVCDALATVLLRTEDPRKLQVFGESLRSGGRWLFLESLSRALRRIAARPEESSCTNTNGREATLGGLASLLAALAIRELQIRHEELGVSVDPADVVAYLGVCAPYSSRPERPLSLVVCDHVTAVKARENHTALGETNPLLGDFLCSILSSGVENCPSDVERGRTSLSEAVGAVVMQGYAQRPLPPLAAIVIAGSGATASASDVGSQANGRSGRGRGRTRTNAQRGVGLEHVPRAAQALNVASTFVAAVATAQNADGASRDSLCIAGDVVAAFPAAIVAASTRDKVLREAGLLFISTVADHGDVLCAGGSSENHRKKREREPLGVAHDDDSARIPLPPGIEDGPDGPRALSAPPLRSVVRLAGLLRQKNSESALDRGELARHLEILLATPSRGQSPAGTYGLDEDMREHLARYLVAWAARLGWRDETASTMLLECLEWANASLRECGIPLLRHVMRAEDSKTNAGHTSLLQILLRSMFAVAAEDRAVPKSSRSPGRAQIQSPAKRPGRHADGERDGATPTATAYFSSDAEEKVFQEILGSGGRAQADALEVLTNACPAVAAETQVAVTQRRHLLRTLVNVAVDGMDGVVVAEAANAIGARPQDLAALVVDFVPAGKLDQKSTAKRGRKSWSAKLPSPLGAGPYEWVLSLAGVVELAQALCSKSGGEDGSSAKAERPARGRSGDWMKSMVLELVRPLFDALPQLVNVVKDDDYSNGGGDGHLLSGSSTSPQKGHPLAPAAEYAMWLTMDLLNMVLRRSRGLKEVGNSVSSIYGDDEAGPHTDIVLTCLMRDPSPQTRNSALALLSTMATIFPKAMASRLQMLLSVVCSAATAEGGGEQSTLAQTQKAVKSVVPTFRAHGVASGVDAHYVIQVFADSLAKAPAHVRRTLYGSLITSLGDGSLTIVCALLLRRASDLASSDGREPVSKSQSNAAEDRDETMDFVHQMVHCSGAQAQISALVGLTQACHRLVVRTADRSGTLSGRALEDAIAVFDTSHAVSDCNQPTYLRLALIDGHEARADESSAQVLSSTSFMTLDLGKLCSAKSPRTLAGETAASFLGDILAFVRDHLISKPLLTCVAAASKGDGQREDECVQERFLMLCEELLLLSRTLAVCDMTTMGSSEPGVRAGVSWRRLQALAYDVFETLQSLLSLPSFVAVIQELLLHQDARLRRKALQLITRRLDPAGGDSRILPAEESLFIDLLPALRRMAMGKHPRPLPPEDSSGLSSGLEEVMGPSSPDVMDENEVEEEESAINRQTALLSLDVLARVLGRHHEEPFEHVLNDVTEIVAGAGPSALPAIGSAGANGTLALRSSAFLLLATLSAVLGVRAFPKLPRFFPAMLAALEHERVAAAAVDKNVSSNDVPDRRGGQRLLWTSALSAVATVAATLPSFLSPYLGRILKIALHAGSADRLAEGADVTAGSRQAADRVLSLLSAGVQPRLLIPAVCGAYAGCVDGARDSPALCGVAARSAARLLVFVQEIVADLGKEGASAALPHFTRLVTRALDFRRLYASQPTIQDWESADLVEKETSSALVALVMKLSEVELQPLFLHLYEWKATAAAAGGHQAVLGQLDRSVAFYRVLDALASALKSIFTPYFAHVLGDCCDDLMAVHVQVTLPNSPEFPGKRKRGRQDSSLTEARKKGSGATSEIRGEAEAEADADRDAGPAERWRRFAASQLILSALRRCFQFDRSGFVDKGRFELILPALVLQLESGAAITAPMMNPGHGPGSPEDEVAVCRSHAQELVGPCLAQLASACGKDALWKSLTNAVLMKTRSPRAGVRVAALLSLRQCFEVIGEEFLSLLPECLSFMSELLEDGHPEVESECRSLVKYIENVLGESIETYLS